ncbi:MAG: glycoside hydrolase family 25 protein, partial [Myxococcota bacterium]
KAQAQNFIKRVRMEPGDLPPVVDIETMGRSAEDKSHLVKDLHVYLDVLEAHYGVKPIIYTGHAFWNAHMDGSFGRYPLWLAQYGSKASIPTSWKSWTFWQYSATGSVSGVSGDVDLDRYCCSLAELRSLTLPASHQ